MKIASFIYIIYINTVLSNVQYNFSISIFIKKERKQKSFLCQFIFSLLYTIILNFKKENKNNIIQYYFVIKTN